MSNYIGSPLKRTAVYRRSKCIIYNQRNSVTVRGKSKSFYIKNSQRRIGNRFSEYRLSFWSKGAFKLFI